MVKIMGNYCGIFKLIALQIEENDHNGDDSAVMILLNIDFIK